MTCVPRPRRPHVAAHSLALARSHRRHDMTVCSARPARLASFADVAAARGTLQTTRTSVAADQAAVEKACPAVR